MRLFNVIMADAVAVEKAMNGANTTLNPSGRTYLPYIYYQHLMMLKALPKPVAQLFMQPLLLKTYLPTPILSSLSTLSSFQPPNSPVSSLLSCIT